MTRPAEYAELNWYDVYGEMYHQPPRRGITTLRLKKQFCPPLMSCRYVLRSARKKNAALIVYVTRPARCP